MFILTITGWLQFRRDKIFYDIVKIRLAMTNDVNIFTLNELLILKIIKNLPAIYQNKTKVLGKSSKLRVKLQEEVICINCTEAISSCFLAKLYKM